MPLIGAALVGPWVLVVALAAGDATAALVLTPTSRSRTVGPALVLGADAPGTARRLEALGIILLTSNLAAWALAARGRRLDTAGESPRLG